MTWASRLSLQRSDQRGRSAHPGCVPSAHAGSPLQDMQGHGRARSSVPENTLLQRNPMGK